MELVGIALSVPAAFVASLIYSILLTVVVRRSTARGEPFGGDGY